MGVGRRGEDRGREERGGRGAGRRGEDRGQGGEGQGGRGAGRRDVCKQFRLTVSSSSQWPDQIWCTGPGG